MSQLRVTSSSNATQAAVRAMQAEAMSEVGLLVNVLDAADKFGWAHHHETDSRRTYRGWPDLVLVRPPRIIVAELKSQKGRWRPGQREWLALFAACGVEAETLRPTDWFSGHIEELLR